MSEKLKKGISFALTAACISGFSIFYNKLVLVKGVDPLIFNIIKNGGVAVILACLLIANPHNKTLLSKALPKQWKKLALVGLIGGSIPFFLFFEGLRQTSAINATLIQKSLFLWVALFALPLLGEKLSFVQIAGYLLVAYVNLFLGGFSGFSWTRGELMILAATFFWTAEVIIVKKFLKDGNATLFAFGRMFFGTIILFLFALILGKLSLFSALKGEQLIPILGSIAFLTGYIVSWYHALKFAPATLATAILILSTPITNILTALFITHTFPQPQVVATLLTVIGIIVIAFLTPAYVQKIRRVLVLPFR